MIELFIYEIMSYMRKFYKRLFICLFVVSFFGISFAKENSVGIKLFMENNPEQAIPIMEKELASANPNLELYNYLGIAYSQVGKFQKAVEIFEKGINTFGTNKKVLYYNLGNAYYKLGNFQKSIDSFSMALVADENFAEPYLNRANSYLRLGNIDNCILDYSTYIVKKPDDPQAPKIRDLLSLLQKEKEFQLAEQKRLEEEALRLKQEEERLAQAKAEQERLAALKKAEEEERRRKLLEEVANSLSESSDTTNMSAGTEDVFIYTDESEID